MEPQSPSGLTHEKAADLPYALDHAAQLLDRDTALALQQTEEILRVFPGQPQALLVQSHDHN